MEKILDQLKDIQKRFDFEIQNLIDKLENEEKDLKNSPSTEQTEKGLGRLVTIKRLCELFPSFTIQGIRWKIFTNEWDFEGHCVKRMGKRRILIDIDAFETWIRMPKHRHQAYDHIKK